MYKIINLHNIINHLRKISKQNYIKTTHKLHKKIDKNSIKTSKNNLTNK